VLLKDGEMQSSLFLPIKIDIQKSLYIKEMFYEKQKLMVIRSIEDIDKELDCLMSFAENGGGYGDPDAKEADDRKIQILLSLRQQEIQRSMTSNPSLTINSGDTYNQSGVGAGHISGGYLTGNKIVGTIDTANSYLDRQLRDFDINELSKIQHSGLKAVWVYAPHPLEAISIEDHIKLRKQVYENIMAGVEYLYFVESKQGISRIKDLAKRMHNEAEEKRRDWHKLVNNIKIVKLTPLHFLTHFTVHHHYTGELDVYQSVVRSDRNDKLERLDGVRSEQVRMLVSEQLLNMDCNYDDGIEILTIRKSKD
jgi:hypothetical protein